MTRTSRQIPEPPKLDPLPDHHGDPMDAPRVPRHGYAPLAGLAILIASAAVMIGGLWLASRAGQQPAPPAAIAAPPAADIACAAPARQGEQLAVFFRHDGNRVVFRCISSRDWDVMPRPLPPSPQ